MWSEGGEGDQMEKGHGQVKAVVRWITECGLVNPGRWSGEGFLGWITAKYGQVDQKVWSGGSQAVVIWVTECGQVDQGRC